MKRIHDKLPIFLSNRLTDMPDHCIYGMTEGKNKPFAYIGTSTNPIERYKKYERLATRGRSMFGHERVIKLDWFKRVYVPGESPIMVVLAEAKNSAHAKELEKEYRERFTDKGHQLINPIGKYQTSPKNSAKRAANDFIEVAFDNWWKIILLIGLVIIGGMVIKGHMGEQYTESAFPDGYYRTRI